jgi:translation initiation factor 4B
VRELGAWERKGPLADLPSSRGNDRGGFGDRGDRGGFGDRGDRGGFGDRDRGDRGGFGEGRRGPREGGSDEGKPPRDFNNLDWNTRKGPLSPLPQPERSGSRDSSRPRTNDGKRTESFRGGERGERRASPATWGEGRQEGSRPPRGEFRDRPERTERPDRPERNPTAADLDNKWRDNMRPGRAAKSPGESRDGSEAPSSPAGPAAAVLASGSRPKLNLAKRTVSEAPGATSPPPVSATDPKANPFGAARPIDTAAKEREIADKKEQLAKEKKEADEKAKEERRLAKEAAAKEASEKAATAEADKEKAADAAADEPSETVESNDTADGTETSKDADDEAAGEQKVPTKPREQVQNPKFRANDSGNWRTASGGEGRSARGGYQSAPRGARGEGRGGDARGEARGGRGGQRGDRGERGERGERGDRGERGGRFEGGRPPRANGSSPTPSQQQPAKQGTAPGTPTTEESADPEGWTTVPSKGRRNPSARA